MRVFISYSSRDRWVARRISDDLAARAIETFLDEKDIETGDSIDDTIQSNLNECDELLMLLSPEALRSHWVMLEVGGAKALRKRLIPVLLHVGVNELPSPLNKGLARDLNDIGKYYEEVQARGRADDGEELPVLLEDGAAAHGTAQHDFKVGDVVCIPETPQRSAASGVDPGWVPPMDEHLGKIGEVVVADSSDRTVRIDTAGSWWWAMDWLKPAEQPDDEA